MLIPLALLAVFAGLALASLPDEAPTIDEVQHLAAGYSYLQTGDFRFGREHPPLMKMIAAAPLLLLELKPVAGSPGWETNDRPTFDRDFLLHNWASPWRMLHIARLPLVAMGVLMGGVVFLWGRDLWGHWPGVFVLFLYALCPNILAHTRLVTTDLGVACFTLLTVFALWRYTRTDRLVWAVTCGLALGAALLAKYSAVVTAVMIPVLLVCSRLKASPSRLEAAPTGAKGGAELSRLEAAPTGTDGRWLMAIAIIVTVAAAIVTIGYVSPFGLADYYHGLQLVRRLWRPEARVKWSFLWGEYSPAGFWSYYLLAQVWKTPIPTLVFFVWGLIVLARHRERWLDAAFLLVPIAAFHAAGMLSDVNIGIRHLLPVFPFVFLVCGAVAWSDVDLLARRPRVSTAVVAVLGAWYVFGTLRCAPHFISFFNELVGGPDNGIYYLDDSNIDWGQDLFRLRQYIEHQPPTRVRVASFAPFDPPEYGIGAEGIGLRDLVWPQPDTTYFVSADLLQRRTLYRTNTAMRFDWLQGYRPVDKVGWSIFVYRFSTDPVDADAAHVIYVPRTQWYGHAVTALRAILAQSPELGEARSLLAQVEAEQAAVGDGVGRP